VILEHHPGPTQGSIWAIIIEPQIIFLGDTVTTNQPPFLATADIPAWLESLDLLLTSYKDFTVVSGRGGVVPGEAVRIQHHLLKNILKGLERLAKRNAPAEATEGLIPSLLGELNFPPQLEDQYLHRLRYGLAQYYARRYRPLEVANHIKPPEEE
jgi:glyoxylase-like metal-dependent hydrolase (beta-lactamase superfamily II)